MGRHYVMLTFDVNHRLVHLTSECEQKVGPDIQGAVELGGNVCHSTIHLVKSLLYTFHERKDRLIVDTDHKSSLENLPEVLRVAFVDMRDTHNSRINSTTLKRYDKAAKLQRRANSLTQTILGLPKMARVFFIDYHRTERVWSSGWARTMQAELPAEFNIPHVLGISIGSQGVDSSTLFAVRDYGSDGKPTPGKWTLNEELLRAWATANHTADGIDSRKYCIFCGQEYSKMSKHTGGAAHIDKVVEVCKLICRATSSLGLKMLNDPKTRNAFK